MTSSDSEEQAPTRKRSRTTTNAGANANGAKESKKARGRPRVDTQDATAADRRRTQIRLAQRAYRQRKETTIASLKQEGNQLHTIIEQMNKTFLRFNESALKSGLLQLNPGLARELKQASETFTSLAKTATDFEVNEEERGDSADLDAESASNDRSQAIVSPIQDNAHAGWDQSITSDRNVEPAIEEFQQSEETNNYFHDLHGAFNEANNSLVPRRQFTIDGILNRSGNASSRYQPMPMTTAQQSEPLPFGLIDLLSSQQAQFPPSNPHIFSVNIPTPEFTPPSLRLPTPPLQPPSLSFKTLAPVFTYSHQETTFARRLTRAALETAFHLLSTAHVRPSAMNYVFRLSLPFNNLEELRERFKMMLSRTVDEDLDFWEGPFVHIGGAGTHYPRKDAKGNIIPRKINHWTVRQIGPREKHMVRMESADDGQFLDHVVDLAAFEGEWFDAYDVAGYLEEHWSCTPDPKASFAQCSVDIEEPEYLTPPELTPHTNESDNVPSLIHKSSSSSNTSSAPTDSITQSSTAYDLPGTSYGLDMNFNNSPFLNNNNAFKFSNNIDVSFDQTLGLDLAPGYDYGFSTDTNLGATMNLGMDLTGTTGIEPMTLVKQKKKTVAWLETSKLIEELIKHALCLGRAPGFRRKDVDMAVRNSLVSAY